MGTVQIGNQFIKQSWSENIWWSLQWIKNEWERNRGANIINVINEYRGELQCTFFFLKLRVINLIMWLAMSSKYQLYLIGCLNIGTSSKARNHQRVHKY